MLLPAGGVPLAGLLLAAGLLTPVAALLTALIMAVASVKAHGKNGYWITANGWEYCFAILTVAVFLGVAGPGAYSLTALF